MLEGLARETRGWTDPLGRNTELFPVVNMSVKISALYSQMNPADPEDAIVHLVPRLRPILRRARELGAFVNFDMESYAHKEATLELFRRLFTEDVINYRIAFLTKNECPPTGLKPHTDVLTTFPYLGTPHAK